MNDQNEQQHYKNRSVWLRGLFMLIFIFLMGVTKFVTVVVVGFQFLVILFTAEKNDNLLNFGKSLSVYEYQVMLYLTYNSEFKPFPMGDWPKE
ncbi:DUF4389 domain-containing protein [Psychromonas sp. MB-3u-54]|uniref:DUF4389 domain-containing protein n=1 Tax=Psychromonas sp. MB-3u-54 TaxID=2058319 RepID=UPI000C32F3CD|nr:DUF4389 domain-containing protein [Psychromonas sp. MB-3u-54]PKH04099.1 DUF4389 domain-containing protein [Psychromonas sp. MB-3u-54]